MRYKIVTSNNRIGLELQVQELLEQRWDLYGDLNYQMCSDASNRIFESFAQAMIAFDDEVGEDRSE